MRIKLVTALLCGFLLTGCAAGQNSLTIQVAELPEATLKCLPAPLKGKKFVKINGKQAAFLIAGYKTAHADCESKLATVRRIYKQWKEKARKA